MRGAGYSEVTHREAAERLVRYAQGERALPVLRRRGPWLRTPRGRIVWFQLIALADYYLLGDISGEQYAQVLVRLAPSTTLPQEDFEVFARYALDFCRCCLIGAGEVCRDN